MTETAPAAAPTAGAPTSLHRSTVTRDTAELAVYEQGHPDRPTVILVHGWPDTHRLWDAVAARLAAGHRVVTYDTRGHGESTAPQTTRAFAIDAFADDLYAVIDAVSPDRPVHVVGHDWGSVQGWEAVCRPDADERIASFTSISGPSLDHLGAWVRARLASPTPRGVGDLLAQLASSAYTGLFMAPALPRLVFSLLGRPRVWRAFLRTIEGTPAESIHLAPTLRADMVSGLRIYSANIVQRLSRPDPRPTDVPVNLLVNRRDIAVRPAVYADAERWVADLSRTDMATGHWVPFHSPNLIAESIAGFVAEYDRPD